MDVAGSYSVAHRTGLLPTELAGMWGWILLRSPRQGRGSPPAPAPTKQRPALAQCNPPNLLSPPLYSAIVVCPHSPPKGVSSCSSQTKPHPHSPEHRTA